MALATAQAASSITWTLPSVALTGPVARQADGAASAEGERAGRTDCDAVHARQAAASQVVAAMHDQVGAAQVHAAAAQRLRATGRDNGLRLSQSAGGQQPGCNERNPPGARPGVG